VAVAAADDHGDLDTIPSACFFNIEASTFFPTTFVPPAEYCTVLVDQAWTLEGQELHGEAG
jgi:hypothetical protein